MESPALSLSKSDTNLDNVSPSLAKDDHTADALPTSKAPFRTRLSLRRLTQNDLKFLSANMSMIALGWNDGATGALIPHIQAYYHISYTIVSLLFIGQFVGNIIAAQSCVYLTRKFGIGKLYAACAFIQAIGYSFVAARLPFPVMACAFGICGFGIVLQDALGNQFVAGLPSAHIRFGVLHFSYGVGATLSPLVATAFVNSGRPWNLFYTIGLAIAVLNCGSLIASFKLEAELEQPVSQENQIELEMDSMREHPEASAANTTEPSERRLQEHASLWQALKLRAVYSGVFLFFFYVGAEVATSGWIVSYLINFRGAGSQAGYVSSGFFAGLTVSRLVLVPVNMWLGEQNALHYYFVVCIGLEFVVWYVKSFVGNAVAVAFIGFAMGPVFPVAMNVVTKLLPRAYHTAAVGMLTSFACIGSAIWPWVVGALSQKYTTKVLQPAMVALFGGMVLSWAFVPRLTKRTV